MNLNAFPFFNSLDQMRAACKHGEQLRAPATRFLPFQIIKPHDGQPIDCVNIYTLNGQFYKRLMGNELTYDYHQSPELDFITYYGDAFAEPLPCNSYYLEIGGKYSAVFGVVNTLSDLLKLEWTNSGNLTDSTGQTLVMYQTGFLQRLYLDAKVLLPVYPFQEDGYNNEYKEFLADFKRISKQSQFDTLALPPYLVDALGALPMHDTVHAGQYREVKEVEVTPTWLDFGKSASVNVKFSEANPVIALGCGNTLELEEFDLANYTPRGFQCGIEDINPYWQATGLVSCELASGENTGYTLIEYEDTNPNSATYGTLRMSKGTLDLNACPVLVTYYSTEQSEYVVKNDCIGDQSGSTVLVKVAAGAFTSTMSQVDANNKALQHLNSIKQQEANALGLCVKAAIYQYAGEISEVDLLLQTASQACAYTGPTQPVYSFDGQIEVGGVLYVANNENTPLANGYYQLNKTQSLQIANGAVKLIRNC